LKQTVNFVTYVTYHKQILISVSLRVTSFHIIIIIAFISGNKAHINRRVKPLKI